MKHYFKKNLKILIFHSTNLWKEGGGGGKTHFNYKNKRGPKSW